MDESGSAASGGAEASEQIARERSVVALLRQLWLGLSTYRLYPENLQRPGFAAVTERIGAAARDALAGGPVDVEIRGGRFLLGGGPLPLEPSLRRLALECFERRVERLTVVGVPDAAELERLFRVLATPLGELEEAGGVEEALGEADASVRVSAIGPGVVEGADHATDVVTTSVTPPMDVDVLASELMLEDLHGTPRDQAETLLSRLRRVYDEQAVTERPPIELHTAAHDIVAGLPDDVRRSLLEMLVDRAGEDPLAGRLIGTMSGAQLARTLVDLGHAGERDPVGLARGLAAAGVRGTDVVDLTRALEAGHEDVGTIIAGLGDLGIDLEEAAEPAGGSVADLLSRYLLATERDDLRSIRAAAGSTGSAHQAAQTLAFADYLSLESDGERAGEAVDIWAEGLRGALRAGDEGEIASLLTPVRDALHGRGVEGTALYAAGIRRALDREAVLEAVTAEAASDRPHLATLLRPFGDEGIEAVLDLLADEPDRTRRALLFGALRAMVPAHTAPVVARLHDHRWFVVRNAVLLLASAGDRSVLPRLAETVRHASPEVRHEIPHAMASVGGAAAVPHLVLLALGADPDLRHQAVDALGAIGGPEALEGFAEVVRGSVDRAVRIRALEGLAGRPEGRPVLARLISRGSGARLPWRVRRHAGRLLARRGTRG